VSRFWGTDQILDGASRFLGAQIITQIKWPLLKELIFLIRSSDNFD